MQYFTGTFQGGIPILLPAIEDAAVLESSRDAYYITALLHTIYGGREWSIKPLNENEQGKNYVVCR